MKQHNKIIVALGTNFEQKKNAQTAESILKTIIKDSYVSTYLWTKPINIENSDTFLNFLIFGKTHYGFSQLNKAFKHLEKRCGRNRSDELKGIIKLDIDILQYGNEIYHIEDWDCSLPRRAPS